MQYANELKRLFENGAITHAFNEVFEGIAKDLEAKSIDFVLQGEDKKAFAEAYAASLIRELTTDIKRALNIPPEIG